MSRDKVRTSIANIGYKDHDMYNRHDMLRDFTEVNKYFENIVDESNKATK